MTSNHFKNLLKRLKQQEKDDIEILHLTANESVMSPEALKWQNSILNGRYILGLPHERGIKKRYFFNGKFAIRGMPVFREIELLAEKSCRKMFSCSDVDFSTLSGLHCMMAVFGSMTNPQDLIMTLSPHYGGHYATLPLLKQIGRRHLFLPYKEKEFELDLDKLKLIAHRRKIAMIYLDSMYYFKPYPLKEIKKIAPEAILVYDGSHILGLIAGGEFQSPLKEGVDILSGNTHKTLPGPQKGIILFKDNALAKVSRPIINNYFVSSTHTGSCLSLFITLIEMESFGCDYATQIVKNSQALAGALVKKGFTIMAYPQIKPLTHQVLLHVNNIKESAKLLDAGLSVNSGSLFGSNFIRLGTQQVTRMGMKEKEMDKIADFIEIVLNKGKISQVKKEVKKMRKKLKKTKYCF